MAWKPKVQDGMLMGDGKGGLFRVFNPPAWRVDRWVAWSVARTRYSIASLLVRLGLPRPPSAAPATGHVTITFQDAKGHPVPVRVRVESVPHLRNNVVGRAIRKL